MTSASLQAAELRAAGEPDQALRLIERVLELQPGHPRARFAAGQLHVGRGRWAAAEQEYAAAAQLEAGDAGQRARCWLGAGACPGMPDALLFCRQGRMRDENVCRKPGSLQAGEDC